MEISEINHFALGVSWEATGNIWKILTDVSEPLLLVQVRDGGSYQTSFTAIDLARQQVLWENFTVEENWWLGMSVLHQGTLLLYTYPEAQKPQPQGIIALDIATKNVIWQTPDLNFYSLTDHHLVATELRLNPTQYVTLNIRTGKVLERFREFKHKFTLKSENNSTIFPFHYHNETAYFQTVAIFLKKKFNLQIVQAVDYLEYDNFIIISYFYKTNDDLSNNLLIMNQSGEILFHQNLEKQLTGIGLDTFFVFKNQLLFVKHKTLLESLQLK